MPSSHTKSDKHVECATLALTWSQAAQFGGHTEVARECWLDSRLGGYGSVVAERVRHGRRGATLSRGAKSLWAVGGVNCHVYV